MAILVDIKLDTTELNTILSAMRNLADRLSQLEADQSPVRLPRDQWHGGSNGSYVLECAGCYSRFVIDDPTRGSQLPPEQAYAVGWILSPGFGWLCTHCYHATATPWQGDGR